MVLKLVGAPPVVAIPAAGLTATMLTRTIGAVAGRRYSEGAATPAEAGVAKA